MAPARISTLFPYTTLFRSRNGLEVGLNLVKVDDPALLGGGDAEKRGGVCRRSGEQTSALESGQAGVEGDQADECAAAVSGRGGVEVLIALPNAEARGGWAR